MFIYIVKELWDYKQQELHFLTFQKPVIPTFYILSKVHKNPVDPTGRPIVVGIGELWEKAIFVDHFLQSLVLQLTSYLHISTSVIQQFGDLHFESNLLLVTCDVKSLYTSISYQHGMAAVMFFLDKRSAHDHFLNSFLIDLLDFMLQHNYLIFDS